MTTSYTLGCDPETFIWDKKSEKFLSAHEFLPGSKRNPFPVEFGAVQVDGVAAEYNVDASTDFKTFKRNNVEVRRQMQEIIQHNGGPNLILVAKPTAHFDQDYFDKLPSSCKELGCEPDYCGEAKGVNIRPNTKTADGVPKKGLLPFRTGGGHIHIGWDASVKDLMERSHFSDCCALAKTLYHSGLRMDYLWDGDKERRQLYGSKYSFRPKSFGMEYRYLSNAWVDDFDAMEFVWNLCRNTVAQMDRRKGVDRSIPYNDVMAAVPPKYLASVGIDRPYYNERI